MSDSTCNSAILVQYAAIRFHGDRQQYVPQASRSASWKSELRVTRACARQRARSYFGSRQRVPLGALRSPFALKTAVASFECVVCVPIVRWRGMRCGREDSWTRTTYHVRRRNEIRDRCFRSTAQLHYIV